MSNPVKDLIDVLPIAAGIVAERGTIIIANNLFCDVFGYGPELVGESVDGLVPDSIKESHAALRTKFHAEGDHYKILNSYRSIKGRKKNGIEFPVEIFLGALPGKNTLVLARDLSELEVFYHRIQSIAERLNDLSSEVFIG